MAKKRVNRLEPEAGRLSDGAGCIPLKTRNPRPEIRRKAEIRNPSPASRRRAAAGPEREGRRASEFEFRASDFGLPSDFGPRVSDFRGDGAVGTDRTRPPVLVLRSAPDAATYTLRAVAENQPG